MLEGGIAAWMNTAYITWAVRGMSRRGRLSFSREVGRFMRLGVCLMDGILFGTSSLPALAYLLSRLRQFTSRSRLTRHAVLQTTSYASTTSRGPKHPATAQSLSLSCPAIAAASSAPCTWIRAVDSCSARPGIAGGRVEVRRCCWGMRLGVTRCEKGAMHERKGKGRVFWASGKIPTVRGFGARC